MPSHRQKPVIMVCRYEWTWTAAVWTLTRYINILLLCRLQAKCMWIKKQRLLLPRLEDSDWREPVHRSWVPAPQFTTVHQSFTHWFPGLSDDLINLMRHDHELLTVFGKPEVLHLLNLCLVLRPLNHLKKGYSWDFSELQTRPSVETPSKWLKIRWSEFSCLGESIFIKWTIRLSKVKFILIPDTGDKKTVGSQKREDKLWQTNFFHENIK